MLGAEYGRDQNTQNPCLCSQCCGEEQTKHKKRIQDIKDGKCCKNGAGDQVPGARVGSEGDIVLTGMVVVEIEMPSEPRLEGDKARKSE